MAAKLSVAINVKNSAAELQACLRSLTFADEVVVVDMDSTDKTAEVAKQAGAHVFHHEDVGYADPARNFALEKTSHDWILVVDADEIIPETLAKYIQELLAKPVAEVYWLPRVNLIFGQQAKAQGWWPDYQPRLFKKGRVSWQVGVHRMPDITGTEAYVAAKPELAIEHHNYRSLSQYLQKLDRYTTIQALERPKLDQSVQASDLIEQFRREFLRRCFLDKGLKDGTQGVGLSLLQSLYEVIIRLKQWEHDQAPRLPSTPKQQAATLSELEKFAQELRYWIADTKVAHSTGLVKWWWQWRRKLRL